MVIQARTIAARVATAADQKKSPAEAGLFINERRRPLDTSKVALWLLVEQVNPRASGATLPFSQLRGNARRQIRCSKGMSSISST